MRTALKSWFLSGGGSLPAFDTLGVIQAGFLSTTEIVCFTTKNGADSYNWYCYDAAGTTLIDQKLATTNQVTFTGLTINTTYTFRATASKMGYAESAPISTQETTFPYMPKFFYSIIGVPDPESTLTTQSNAFGNLVAINRISKIKSIIKVDSNVDIDSSTATTGSMVVAATGDLKPYKRITPVSTSYFLPPTPTVLSGDITLGFEMVEYANNFRYLASNSDGSFQLRKGNNQTNWLVTIGAVGRTVSYPTNLELSKIRLIVYQRRNTNPDKTSNTATQRIGFLLSDGTMSWGPDQTLVKSNDISIQRWFLGASGETLDTINLYTWFGAEKLLSDSEIEKSFNFYKMANYALADKYTGPLTIKGAQNWTTVPSNGEVADPKLDNTGTTTRARGQRVVVVGDDKAFIDTHQNLANSYDDQIRVYDFSNNKISDNLLIPTPGSTSLNNHNSGSINEIDNTILQAEAFHHNASSPARNIYLKWLGPNFNLTEYTDGIQCKGFSKIAGNFEYIGIHKVGNAIVFVVQEWDDVSASNKYLGCLVSYDRGNSWDYFRICIQSGTDWYYPNHSISTSATEIMIIIDPYIGVSALRPYQFLARINPFTKIISNLSGGFTKDVSANGSAVTYAELVANFDLSDGVYVFAGSDKKISSRCHWDGVNGYAIGGNGDGTAYVLYEWTIAGGVSITQLDFGSNPIDFSNTNSDADNAICVIRRGAGSYLFVVRETISTKKQFVLYSTTDGGATELTREAVLSQSAGSDFVRANINGDVDYTSKWLLNGIKKDGGGAGVGTYFIKDLSSYA